MTLLVPFFSAHAPQRLRSAEERRGATAGDLQAAYFDDDQSRQRFLRVADNCYRPATRLLLDLVKRHADRPKPFRIAFGLSGTFLSQAERYAPDVLDLFKELGGTGHVEFTGATFYHSLSALFDDARLEFREQVELHRQAIWRHFGQSPSVFCNTRMLYNNAIAGTVEQMGFCGMLTEGVDWLMAGWRSPDFVYRSLGGLPLLLRNYRLSDDIAFRFADKRWEGYPLTAHTYAGWLARNTDPVVLLALDYEALGEHISAETGIFEFLEDLPEQTARFPQLAWATPAQALSRVPITGTIDVPVYSTISAADYERDTSAWLGNEMQQFCYEELKDLEPLIRTAADPQLQQIWRLLQSSSYLRALSTKAIARGADYHSNYGQVTDAFVRLQSALYDLKRLAQRAT